MEHSAEVEALVLRVVAGVDPAERLQALSALRRELDKIEAELAAAAVHSGMSWRQIGSAIGVSKQAAHRRHSQSVSRRDGHRSRGEGRQQVSVSPYARRAVRVARQEAARMGRTAIGTEHLLLGILQCGDPEAQDLMKRFDITLTAALDALEPTTQMTLEAARRAYRDSDEQGAANVVSPLTRRVMERALTRVAAHGEGELSVLDLLGSTLTHEDGGAARTLRTLGHDPAVIRDEISRAQQTMDAQRL